MTVIALEERIVSRLNSLPPHSRLRPGYIDIMRQIKKEQLSQDPMTAMLTEALRLALEGDAELAAMGRR